MKRRGIMLVATGLLVGSGMLMARAEEATEGRDRPVAGQQNVRGGGRGDMPRGGMRGAMNEWVFRRMMSDPKAAAELGLTEEQVKTIKSAFDQVQTQREPLVKQLAEVEEEARALMDAATVDETAVLANLEKSSKIRLDMEKAGVKAMILVRKTLTPEQVEKFKNLPLRRPEGRPARRGDGAEGAPRAEKPVEK